MFSVLHIFKGASSNWQGGEGGGQVYWGVEGVAPNRSLIITWSQMQLWDGEGGDADSSAGGDGVTFQLQLLEEGGAVKMLYPDTELLGAVADSSEGASAAVGVVGKLVTEAQGLKPVLDLIPSGYAILLTPNNI